MFEDIINKAPEEVKEIVKKDPRLTALLKTVYEIGRFDAQYEIAKCLARNPEEGMKLVKKCLQR
jgi:hypothetical protein